jgi:hypothetical protein
MLQDGVEDDGARPLCVLQTVSGVPAMLQTVGRGASNCQQRCYKMTTTVLQYVSGIAPKRQRLCYKPSTMAQEASDGDASRSWDGVALPQRVVDDATTV